MERLWEELRLVKVYTKKRGEHPDLSDPICLRKGATIEVLPKHIISLETHLKRRTRMYVKVFTGP